MKLEFIEIFNDGPEPYDLTGYRFTRGSRPVSTRPTATTTGRSRSPMPSSPSGTCFPAARSPRLPGPRSAALRSIVASQLLLPVAHASVAVIAGFETLNEKLVQAVDELDAASLLEAGIRVTISNTLATIRSIEKSLTNLTGPIDDLLDN